MAVYGSRFLAMPVLTRRVSGGIDPSGNFLFAVVPINIQTVLLILSFSRIMEEIVQWFPRYEFRLSPTPLDYTGELTFVACGYSTRKGRK